MTTCLFQPAVRSAGIFVFGFVVLFVASTLAPPGYAAASCPCFSSADIVERCQVRASNARTESDRFLTMSCRPPSETGLIQRYVSGAYAVANGVAVDWTCTKVIIPDDGSRWTRDEKHISKDEEMICRQNIEQALKTLVVRDDPEILKACAAKCTVEGLRAECRTFWNARAKELKEAGEDVPQSELDELLAECDQREPNLQKCKAECL